MPNYRYRGGLWAALLIILLLPILFFDSGYSSSRLSRPLLGIKKTQPRAHEIWQYFCQADESVCWLGGPLVANQYCINDPTKIKALSAIGDVLWTEIMPDPCLAVSSGEKLLLATAKGQISYFAADKGIVWSESTNWPAQAMAINNLGEIAIAQGPVYENDTNSMERVRLYAATGSLTAEYLLRNSSVIAISAGINDWYAATVLLTPSNLQGQLVQINPGKSEVKTLWRGTEIIQALAVKDTGIAIATGCKIEIISSGADTKQILTKGTIADIKWVDDDILAVAESGDTPIAAAHINLVKTNGVSLWRKRLRGPCRSLVVSNEEIMVADPNIVYSFSLTGDINWCYESPFAVQGVYPLADKKEVVVATSGNHLILLEIPSD